MLYASYKKRIEKVAAFFKMIVKYRYVILSVIALAFLSTGGFLLTKGMVTDKIECPKTMVYGENLNYEANGLFSDVVYQYSTDPSFATYSSEMPRLPGAYYVRAVSTGSFNSTKYGKIHEFKIVQKTIDVKVKEDTWTYGNTPTVEATLPFGDSISCSAFNYSNLGSSMATVSAVTESITVLNENGLDVTNAYAFNPIEKSVTLSKRDVTITVGNAEKEYDSLPLQFEVYEITSGNLVEFNKGYADSLVATYSSLTNAGVAANIPVSLRVFTSTQEDVTHLYNFTVVEGSLTVNKRPVIFDISSESNTVEFLYDGEAHHYTNYSIDSRTPLIDGHREVLTNYPTITNVGKIKNYLQFNFFDESNVDVTNNYSVILPENKYIEITKRGISVTTPSEEWTYDSNAHSNGNFIISEPTETTGLLEGHVRVFTDPVEIINASSIENSVTLIILDANQNNVTDNYEITYSLGTLTVNPRPIEITTATKSWTYDAQNHFCNEWIYTNTEASEENKFLSDHIVETENEATVINVCDGIDNTFSLVIKDSEGNPVTDNYAITYNHGTLAINKRPVYIVTHDGSFVYDTEAHNVTTWEYKVFLDGDTTEHYTFVESHETKIDSYESFTDVDETLTGNNVLSIRVFDGENDVTANYDIHYDYGTVEILSRPVYVVTGSGRFVYDAQPHSVTTWQYKSFDDNDETPHFTILDSHTSKIGTSKAFTEVKETQDGNNEFDILVFDGETDVTDNYNFIYEYGTVEIYARPVYVVTDGGRFVYNAQPHSVTTWNYKVFDAEDTTEHYSILDSHEDQVGTSISFTNVNETNDGNNVFDILVFDGETDVTDNYNFIYEYGTVEIYARPIYIVTDDGRLVYNGEAQSIRTWDYKVFEDGDTTENYEIVSTHSPTVNDDFATFTTVKDSGVENNVFTISIWDGESNVTENYAITYEYGSIEIYARPVYVVSDNGRLVYNGEAQSICTWDYKVFEDGDTTEHYEIVSFHEDEIDTFTTFTTVNPTEVNNNFLTITILDGETDVTENYEIHYEQGTVEIYPRPVYIVTDSGRLVYNGEAQSVLGWDYKVFEDGDTTENYEILSFQNYKVDTFSSFTNVNPNEVNNNFLTITIWESETDVTENYEIHYEQGTVEIYPRPVYIVTDSDRLVYNGEAQSVLGWDYKVFADGDTTEHYEIVSFQDYVVDTFSSFTNVNPNVVNNNFLTIKILDGETDVTENYEIHYEQGTVEIYPRPVYIVTNDARFVYDAKPHSDPDWKYKVFATDDTTEHYELVANHTWNTTDYLSFTLVKETAVGNNIFTIKIWDGNTDVSENYEIHYEQGTVEIYPRPIYIVTDSDRLVYNGEAQSVLGWDYKVFEDGDTTEHYEILSFQDYVVDTFSSFTNVNPNEKNNNFLTIRILDGETDVTENYEIHYEQGTVEIYPRPVYIVTDSDRLVYNGEAQSVLSWHYKVFADGDTTEHYEIVSFQNYKVDTFSSFTNVNPNEVNNNFLTIRIWEGETDVTENYEIHYEQGTVEIYPRPIYIVTDSGRLVYNGEAQSICTWDYKVFADGDTTEHYEILSFQDYVVATFTSFTNVNPNEKNNNFLTITIWDGKTDVTGNYEIHYEQGTVEIYPRPVYIVTDSDRLVYNGEAQSVLGWNYKTFADGDTTEHYEIVSFHKDKIDTFTTFTNVKDTNEKNNVFTIKIWDGDTDVSENYEIHYDYGTVEIYARPIYIVTDDGRLVYNGEAQSVLSWHYKVFADGDTTEHYEIVSFQDYVVDTFSSFTNVNPTEVNNNFLTIKILDGETDVTENYEIHYEQGTVEIYPRPIYIVTNDARFVYDAKPHSDPDWKYKVFATDDTTEHYELVANHTWNTTDYLSFTLVKETAVGNNIFTIKIWDGTTDVSENYEIHYEQGTVEIYPRPVYIVTNDARSVYDANSHSAPGWKYKVFAIDDTTEHYELVTNHTWITTDYLSFTLVKETAVGNNVFTIKIWNGDTDVSENYEIHYDYGTVEIYARPIYIVTDDGRLVYNGEAQSVLGWDYKVFADGDTTEHYEIVSFHKDKIDTFTTFTNVKDTKEKNNVFTIKIWDGTTDVTENYEIHYEQGTVEIYPRPVYIVTDSDRLVYNGEAQSVLGWDYKVFADGDTTEHYEIVSFHKDKIDTFTTFTNVKDTKEKNNVFTIKIWNGDTDVSENYEIHYDYGTVEIYARPIYIVTDSDRLVYNGEAQSVLGWDYKVFADGDTTEHYEIVSFQDYVVATFSSFTNVNPNEENNNFLTITIWDGETDVTGNYEIHYEQGTVEIYPRPVYIVTDSDRLVYNGEAKSDPDWKYKVFADGDTTEHYELVTNHTWTTTDFLSFTLVNETSLGNNVFTIKIWNGDTDVSENYEIHYDYGTVEIYPRPVYIVTNDARSVYDANSHSAPGWEYKVFAIDDTTEHYKLVTNHTWTTTDFLSFTLVNETSLGNNVFTIKIWNGDTDVSENYEIHYDYGTVEIYPRPIYIVTGSDRLVYNGEAQSVLSWDYKVFADGDTTEHYKILSFHKGKIDTFTTFTNVMDTKEKNNVFTIKIWDGTTDVSENYEIHYDYGTVEIYPRPIYIVTGSYEGVYNGEIRYNDQWDYSGEIDNQTRFELVSGHTTKSVSVPMFKNVTYADNNNIFAIEIYAGNDNVTDNYEINYSYGTIRITKRVIYIVTGTESWEYDDEPHSNLDWDYHSETPYKVVGVNPDEKSHTAKIDSAPYVTYVTDGIKNNALTLTILDENQKPVTDNYDIQIKEMGKISIIPREITVDTVSNKWEYDSKPHSDPRFEITSETTLVDGHEITFTNYTTITEVGTKLNALEYVIKSGDNVLTENYTIIENPGTLTITIDYIEVCPDFASKEYDGTPLVANNFLITYGTLQEGHRIVAENVRYTGSITNIGSGESYIEDGSIKIVDENNNDVTSIYSIYLHSGTLTVTKRTITVTAGSAEKYYDGTPLSCNKFSVSDKLLNGHSLTASTAGARTDVGTSPNTIIPESIEVVDSNNIDVTDIYEFTYEEGTLTILHSATILITSGSAQKEYDSTPLTSADCYYEIIDGAQNPSDIITITAIGSQTEIGSSKNSVTVTITDSEGNDVSYRYNVEYNLGDLTVTKREIIIVTGGDWKYHDGKPLTNNSYLTQNLLKGHSVVLTTNGSQTDIGKSLNTVLESSVQILDANGATVSDEYYNITFDFGLLVVKDKSEGDTYGGDLDTSGNIGGGKIPGGSSYEPAPPRIILQIKSTGSGSIYMRLTSFGNYTGTGWTAATPYEEYLLENYGFNYLVAYALSSKGIGNRYELEVKSYTNDYLLPYFLSMEESNHVIQGSDVGYSVNEPMREYSVIYYSFDGNVSNVSIDLGTLSEAERIYREWVYAQYGSIDSCDPETQAYIMNLIAKQGWSKDDPNIIYKVQRYVQNCATYNLMYDPNLDRESNMIIAFLDEYKEGVCRHYASAATLIFRALEIPARYTCGYVGSTSAGEWTNIDSEMGHAWTEIYIDGLGWIPVEVTGAGAGSGGNVGNDTLDNFFNELDDELLSFEVSPVDVSKVYDGETLYAKNEIKIPYNSVLERLQSLGFTFENIVVEGSRTEKGVSESTIVSFDVYYDGFKVTDKFNITFIPGEIRISEHEATILLYEVSAEYNGKPHYYESEDYYVILPDGYFLTEFEFNGSQTDAGEFDVDQIRDLHYVITNENGEDVTDSFYLKIEGRGFVVKRRAITICSASVTKVFDGTELSDDTVTVTMNTLVEGHQLICDVSASITDVGQVTNRISGYCIVDEYGRDVTHCYEVTIIHGTLEIIKGSNV